MTNFNYNARNPILNSPDDITDDLIQKIINNNLDTLTINYEFTRREYDNESEDDWIKEQIRTNPFWRANNVKPIKRIEFEIKLTSAVHSLAAAFYGFEKLEYVNLNNTAGITNMKSMFWNAVVFNQPIGHWNTSCVTDMSYMFQEARLFNQPIENWDTSNVITMRGMFCVAMAFNQPLNGWDTSNVTDMYGMFYGAVTFNQPSIRSEMIFRTP